MYGASSLRRASSVAACLLLFVYAEAWASDIQSTASEPINVRCPGATQVIVRAVAAGDAEAACEGVRRALRFMAPLGLQALSATMIEIVPNLPEALNGRAVGCYLRETGNIRLLTYAAFAAGGQWFRMPTDLELYRAAAAHEMAHAVVGCHSGSSPLPVAAHEYVAYVVMFGTLEPRLRERVLEKFPGTGFRSTVQINDVNHIVNPNQFGVDAWRHFLRRKDQASWMNEIIAGRVVQPFASDGP